jgi:hypothetical protein
VRKGRDEILEWESRWLVPAGAATFLAVGLLVVGTFVGAVVNGEGKAEILRSAHEHGSNLLFGSTLQTLGFVLLVAPLFVLFRAAQARSDRVRPQLIGLIVVAPLFFAVATALTGVATTEAADQFAAGNANSTLTQKEAASECRDDLHGMGAKKFAEEYKGGGEQPDPQSTCMMTKVEDEAASNAISEASVTNLAEGLSIGGRLGLAVSLLYTCLWAMRVGLLTRFWGSLGMALGVATLLGLVLFVAIWFIYVALLLIGRVPAGRPPAWAAGEAIPWPTPGERAAESLEASEPDPDEPEEPGDDDPGSNGSNGSGGAGGERRKRKRRG